ncbi:hypothetical protein ODS41_06420 [Pyrobaculum sp. 3827-6]|jgi:hypothetical protein|nr:hypothetical protein [Pyrobaculum sp. 3827-6]
MMTILIPERWVCVKRRAGWGVLREVKEGPLVVSAVLYVNINADSNALAGFFATLSQLLGFPGQRCGDIRGRL